MTRSIRTSLTPMEIQLLDYMMSTILRGGDPKIAARHKSFASLARKVKAMKTAAKEADDDTDQG